MMALASIVAVAYVLGQGVLLWVALRFVRSFGAFVESHQRAAHQTLLTHESQMLIHKQNLQALEKIEAVMQRLNIPTKEVA